MKEVVQAEFLKVVKNSDMLRLKQPQIFLLSLPFRLDQVTRINDFIRLREKSKLQQTSGSDNVYEEIKWVGPDDVFFTTAIPIFDQADQDLPSSLLREDLDLPPFGPPYDDGSAIAREVDKAKPAKIYSKNPPITIQQHLIQDFGGRGKQSETEQSLDEVNSITEDKQVLNGLIPQR